MDNELPKWKDLWKILLIGFITIAVVILVLLFGIDKIFTILFYGMILFFCILFIWLFVRLCNDVHKIALAMRQDEKEHK